MMKPVRLLESGAEDRLLAELDPLGITYMSNRAIELPDQPRPPE